MALEWDVTQIEDHKSLVWPEDRKDREDSMNPVTKALIFHMMSAGFTGITEDNYAEVTMRIAAWEAVMGTSISDREDDSDEWSPRPITVADVKRHIGLRTNVSPKTWNAWASDVKEAVERWGTPVVTG